MAQRDSVDFMLAFAVGAVLGAGATLLLRPEPPSRTQRILKELEPYRKRIRRDAERARTGLGTAAGATGELGSDLLSAGREFIQELRTEMAEVVANTRQELAQAVEEETRNAMRRASRRRRDS